MSSEDTRERATPQASLGVRDALLELFRRAVAGQRTASERLQQLSAWSRGEDRPPDLQLEDGQALFQEWGQVHPRFEKDEGYLRDRAIRYGAALSWIAAEGTSGNPLDCARAAWDAGLFLEVHELVEARWRELPEADRRPLQGWILAATGLHKLCEGDLATARELLGDATLVLEDPLPPSPYAWGPFAAGLRELAAALEAGHISGPESLEDIPRLEKSV